MCTGTHVGRVSKDNIGCHSLRKTTQPFWDSLQLAWRSPIGLDWLPRKPTAGMTCLSHNSDIFMWFWGWDSGPQASRIMLCQRSYLPALPPGFKKKAILTFTSAKPWELCTSKPAQVSMVSLFCRLWKRLTEAGRRAEVIKGEWAVGLMTKVVCILVLPEE